MRTYALTGSSKSSHQRTLEKRKVSALFPPPEKQAITYVADRVVTVRRRRYQDDDRYQHYTEATLVEQVYGVERDPVDQGDGWWIMGRIVDVIAHVEQTDATNCGTCGHSCSGATPACWNGSCVCGDVCAGGCQFSTVQAAIDGLPDGSTIRICAGTYGAITVTKNLTLIGAADSSAPASNTVLDAAMSG